MTASKLWKKWRSFWFEPQSAASIAVFRIFFGLILLQSALIHIGPDFLTWYGRQGIVTIDSVQQYFWSGQPRFDALLLFDGSDQLLVAYFVSYMTAAFFLTIGFATRYSAAYVCLGLISMHHHNPFNINGGDAFIRLASMFLPFSAAGELYSVDWAMKRRVSEPFEERKYSPWAQRMIQIQLSIVYCHTFFCKISGPQWLDGTAVYYATHLDDLCKFSLPIFDNWWMCKSISWYTLAVELAMWTVVWIKAVRYYVLAAALLLHLGIDMEINLPIFEWVFIAALVTFVEPKLVIKVVNRLKKRLSAHLPALPMIFRSKQV